MFLQARGPGVFQELTSSGAVVGLGKEICLDSINLDTGVEGEWSHKNKCGEVDVEDASGYDSLTATLTLSFADVQDKNFALAALGEKVAAAGGTSTVLFEEIPSGVLVGDVWYAGGKNRHFNLTAVTVYQGNGSPTGPALVLNTDYTLDAARGKIKFLTAQASGALISYTHQDPASVSLLSTGVKNYQFSMDYYNRLNNNQKGTLVLYNIRPNPASGMDFMSPQNQTLTLTAKVLADLTREPDDELGQFGFRSNVD